MTFHGEKDEPGKQEGAEPERQALAATALDGRYSLEEPLAEGGAAVVYRAHDRKLDRKVAVKIIDPAVSHQPDELAARFQREASVIARLVHPHVSSALDYGSLPDGRAWLVMELSPGVTLRERIEERGALPWPRMVSIGIQVADALSVAHEAGVVHRDLKPENLMLEDRDGEDFVRVLDFGVAGLLEEHPDRQAGKAALTRLGTTVGTLGYMSPEQCVGDPYDHRTDLYTLGILLWEGLTGEVIFDGPDDITAFATRALSGQVTPPVAPAGRPSVPPALAKLVLRLLSPQPEDRPHSALEVKRELRTVLEEAPAAMQPFGSGIPGLVSPPEAPPPEDSVFGMPAAGVAPKMANTAPQWAPAPKAKTAKNILPLAIGAAAVVALATLCIVGGAAAVLIASVERDDTKGGAEAGGRGEEPFLNLPFVGDEGPPALKEDIGTLMQAGTRARERRKAARAVMAWSPEEDIPTHVRTAAELELARGCRGKREVLARILEEPEEELRPVLEHWAEQPTTGCGRGRHDDCWGCMREAIGAAQAALGEP